MANYGTTIYGPYFYPGETVQGRSRVLVQEHTYWHIDHYNPRHVPTPYTGARIAPDIVDIVGPYQMSLMDVKTTDWVIADHLGWIPSYKHWWRTINNLP